MTKDELQKKKDNLKADQDLFSKKDKSKAEKEIKKHVGHLEKILKEMKKEKLEMGPGSSDAIKSEDETSYKSNKTEELQKHLDLLKDVFAETYGKELNLAKREVAIEEIEKQQNFEQSREGKIVAKVLKEYRR